MQGAPHGFGLRDRSGTCLHTGATAHVLRGWPRPMTLELWRAAFRCSERGSQGLSNHLSYVKNVFTFVPEIHATKHSQFLMRAVREEGSGPGSAPCKGTAGRQPRSHGTACVPEK